MRVKLKILRTALVNAYDAAFSIVLSNIFFIAFCIPIITIPLSVAGLFYTNYELASGEPVDWKTFFYGIKRHWWAGIRWTIFNIAVLYSLLFYFFFLISQQALWAMVLLGLDLGILAFWILMQFLTFPFMIIQEKPGYLMSLRNALVFIVRWPGFSFTFLMPIVILIIASLFLPPLWFFLSVGLVAFLGSYAVYYRIESERHPEMFNDPRHETG